ncbi:MAG: ATPase, T2SS/T4P/T4SS family [Candidatus Omnitrophota bacterium]
MADKVNKKISRLGDKLVEKGLITDDQLKLALTEQKKTGDFLGSILVGLGTIREEDLYLSLSEQLDIPYIKIKESRIATDALSKVSAKLASQYKIMPIKFEKNVLTVAVRDPLNIKMLDDLKLILGCNITAVLACETDILEAIKRYYGIGADTIQEMMDTKPAAEEPEIVIGKTEDIQDVSGDASIIRFVNQILMQAIKDKATDIHIEPYENELKVRYRVDGVLYDIPIPQDIKYFASSIASRIKVMSNLDISEKRLPQDGRVKIKMGRDEMDLRISTLPTQFGESVNIRLLTGTQFYSLEKLGLFPDDMKIIERLIKKPHGIIFTTGPTGSGKTTTLYSCISKINTNDKKIITIEDPIEYQLKGVTQIQVNPKTGLTFAQGLRSMLRHDPDIMMVGEVRDYETAEITIRAALTGHLVFSTIHTNDAAGGVARLLDIGVEPYLVASSVDCFLAQRLVRVICSKCKTKVKIDESILRDFGAEEKIDMVDGFIYEGKGCEECKFSGYKGRTGIYEFLAMGEDIRSLVIKRAPASQIKQKALELGMHTLRMDGWEKIKKGITTINEVIRVTGQD